MSSFWQPRFRVGVALGGLALLGACVVGACGGQAAATPGQLVVAIDTDMALPDQVDTIELVVTVAGTTIYDYPIPVGTGSDSQPIPATLTLVAGPDPNAPVTVRVVGIKGNAPRTLRQVTSTIPAGRVATLRMPVQWLCDGSAQPVAGADGGITYESTCGPGGTCHAGTCVPTSVDSSNLPAYQPQDVFGGGSAPSAKGHTTGSCFDVIACMIGGTVETPDDPSTCSIPVPSDASNVNVALRVANDGICDTTGETCFVPLDGDSAEGWTVQNGRAALPSAVCDKLRTGLVQGVVLATGCPTKTQSTPPCGNWSSVALPADASTVAAHSDAGPPPTPTLLASTAPEGGSVSACCPLLADSTSLYTCLCDGSNPPQIVSIDPMTGATAAVGSLSARAAGSQYAAVLGTTAAGSQIYWVDHQSAVDGGSLCPIRDVPVSPPTPSGQAPQTLANVAGDIYDGADLLIDPMNIYALADAVEGLSTLQLLRIDRTAGMVTPLDTGGALPAYQFTQDSTSLYVAVYTDESLGDGSVERVSRIVSFAKSGAATATTLQQVTLSTAGQTSVGFLGLQSDGTSLFALYQAPKPDGTAEAQVLKIDGSDAGPAVVYDTTLDPNTVSLRMMGATNGAVLLARDITPAADAGAAAADESAILVLPSGGGTPRIVASFQRDRPIFEIQTPSFTPDTFWINSSGRVFRLPAAALR